MMVYSTFDTGIFAHLTEDGELIEAKRGKVEVWLAVFNAVLLLALLCIAYAV